MDKVPAGYVANCAGETKQELLANLKEYVRLLEKDLKSQPEPLSLHDKFNALWDQAQAGEFDGNPGMLDALIRLLCSQATHASYGPTK